MHIPYYIDLFAFTMFAISGALAVEDKISEGMSYDLFSVSFIAFLTSIGGGTVRDIVLGKLPVTWTTDGNFLLCIGLGIFIAVLFKKKLIYLRRTFFLFDTIGMGLYTILATQKAIDAGVSLPAAVIIGMFSSVMGGVIRDMMINETPLIFRKEIYATACLAGAFLFVLLIKVGVPNAFAAWAGMITIIMIRIIAVKYQISLPKLPEIKKKAGAI